MRLMVLLLLSTALAGCAQTETNPEPLADVPTTGAVRGLVTDGAIVPIEGAVVSLGASQVLTGPDGKFQFADVEPGAWFIDVNATDFIPSQLSVQVTPGEVAEVRIVLDPLATTIPYGIVTEYTGFIACEAIVATFIESCDAGTGQFGEPDNAIFLPAEDRVPDAVQVEVVWDNTQALGNSLTSTWASCTGGAYCNPLTGYTMCQHWGASPLWCRSTLDDVAASGTVGQISTVGAVGHGRGTGVGVGLLVKADCTLCADPVAPEAGLGVVVQQRIQTYASSFYNMVPPQGWVFATDGMAEP